MLIDAFPESGGEFGLHEVLEQRMQYLIHRAEVVAERPSDRDKPQWQARMALASLWMEAAEGAAALDRIDVARNCLARATESLLQLRLPLGAALQRVFKLRSDDAMVNAATAVVDDWHDVGTPTSAFELDHMRLQAKIKGAFDTAQQWAYYVLAKAGTDAEGHTTEESVLDDWKRDLGVLSAPVGRLRLPLKDYITVAMVTQQAIRREGNVKTQEQKKSKDIVEQSLFTLYRILKYASENTYLWRRLLSPVPIFDLDTALLVARLQEVSLLSESDWIPGHDEHLVSKEPGRYAREFIHTVSLLRQERGPERGNDPTPVPAPYGPESGHRAEKAVSHQ